MGTTWKGQAIRENGTESYGSVGEEIPRLPRYTVKERAGLPEE